MGAFISKQPNGLYCRFSTVVDCPTDWNMTEKDYINLCKERAEEEAKEVLEKHLKPFDWVKEHFTPNEMSQAEFNTFLEETSEHIEVSTPQEKKCYRIEILYDNGYSSTIREVFVMSSTPLLDKKTAREFLYAHLKMDYDDTIKRIDSIQEVDLSQTPIICNREIN